MKTFRRWHQHHQGRCCSWRRKYTTGYYMSINSCNDFSIDYVIHIANNKLRKLTLLKLFDNIPKLIARERHQTNLS
jgi:hypothetical protein